MSANELYTKGARIWMPDPEQIWRAAELLEDYKGQVKVKIRYEEGEESLLEVKEKKSLPHLRNPDILIGENDLTSLSYLNEPEVLYNLKVRFLDTRTIYTYCGIVLVAINPYEQLEIYGNDIIHAYSGQDMGAMDPHIYAVAEEAFKRMARFEQNQSIIVSGESGAGKTVSAKYAMRFFATVGGSASETQVEKRVLASNPIMEAIGNAKTIRNDNSSRFGKYIELGFNKQNEIIRAHMRTYLLEKSRVVFQASDERNYHIFYQLCASAHLPEFKKFQLGPADSFFYTSQGQNPEIDDVDDAEDLQSTREALLLLGISEKDQMMIFQILSAILHFGNVKPQEKEGETCEIPAKNKSLNNFCTLLGIEESQMRMWLCHRKITTVNEVLTKPLTVIEASFAQDALAKCIYSKMFDWIVTHLNRALSSTGKQHRFIGVLDIYGFETFEVNSFEQFCINYANEKLQQIFNMHVFKLEQEEYVKEEIEWSFIDFYDNQPCIDLIESKLGILDLLDEECKMPKGSDDNWCQKLYDKHFKKGQEHSHFDKPKMSRSAFIVNHFADRVTYQAHGFLEKNRDTVLQEHVDILKASEYELVAELFNDDAEEPPDKRQRSSSRVTPLKKSVPANKQHKKTVGSQFRDSLLMLMETLNATTSHYIRCIKPNDLKEAFTFDPKRVVEQLRACGVLETIRISAAGYPSRWTYLEFFQRYRVLARSKDIDRKDHRKTCNNVLTKLIQDEDKYRFGRTKIFFRAGQVAYLEKLRADKLRACGMMIQKHVRGWLARKRYMKLKKSALLIQAHGRGLLARRYAQFLRRTNAATIIQKMWRGHLTRRYYKNVHKAIVKIQTAIRGFMGRQYFKQKLYEHKTVIIQSAVRGWLAKRHFKKIMYGIIKVQGHFRRRKAKNELKRVKIEAKSVEHIKTVNKGLENKIIELQQKLDEQKKIAREKQDLENYNKQIQEQLVKYRADSEVVEKSSNRIADLEEELRRVRVELENEREEKKDLVSEKELMKKEHQKVVNILSEENNKLKGELDEANKRVQEQEKNLEGYVQRKVEEAKRVLLADFDSERLHHQRLVKEHNRLQQRFENVKGEIQVLTSPDGHKRTPSDISMISVESVTSSVSPDEKKEGEEEEAEKEDQGYGTQRKKKPAPAPPTAAITIEKIPEEPAKQIKGEAVDVGLVLKLQNKIKTLEREREQLRTRLEQMDEEKESKHASSTGGFSDSVFNNLKMQLVNADDVALVIKLQKRVKDLEQAKLRLTNELDEKADEEEENLTMIKEGKAYHSLKMQELQNENDKLKREVTKLMKAISESANFESKGKKTSKASKEFMDQFEAMADELERRREECIQLRSHLAERSISSHAIAKEYYSGSDDRVNEDNELAMAYQTQRDLNRLLENQLQKTEKELKRKEVEYTKELNELKKDNDRHQKIIEKSLNLSPDAKIEATMQHEITRLTSENLDLRETIDKQNEQIRKLKKMLKVYAKRLKEGDAAEIQAELEMEEAKSVENVAQIIHRERNYLGMLEYKKEDEAGLIKNLITDLKPRVATGLLPGLPAYIMFMCVRHTDYINDDEKVRSLLTSSINGIKKVVKKHHDDLDRVTMWLANTCRLLHTLKQYSGEKAFQAENTSRQNEHCLRNFDLSEYRQVFSDLAIWIYQTLIKQMEASIQPTVVPAVLEHEAIAGLSGSKPSGMRGRSGSRQGELDHQEVSLESLMKTLNSYMRVLTQHAVDPELIKQIFRQVYYFLCACALNNLLLRKDMCNWSKGMQIRYNLSHLEQWLRDNKLNESGAQAALEPIIQASQLLQARKTDADVESVCDMCSKLTVAQIVKILNLYTPVDEFEERVPITFIRKIQERLKGRPPSDNTLLMDLKFSYSVTFPFNPSSIAMETIEVPESLHMGFLTRL
ncbi:hypothetical protein CHS0354_008749 [Potamilus streckersoni]|uniref:Unconventional myosin-Va n=1 Tax=Potamilus streckersoni TaxID=2493646 RepID=A0AAE0T5Y3_9BIVA|nr:hypothetical protein CHS0354_008749 [Potamilus streckersoni]